MFFRDFPRPWADERRQDPDVRVSPAAPSAFDA